MKQRWPVIILVLVASVVLVFGGVVQFLLLLLPEDSQDAFWPLIVGIIVTYMVVLGVVTTMQWFGISPLDFLPDKSLREQDPDRFRITKSKDENILYHKAREAEKTKNMNGPSSFREH